MMTIKGFGSVVVTKIDSTHNVGLLMFTSNLTRPCTTIQPLQDIKGFAGDVGEKLKPAAQMVRNGELVRDPTAAGRRPDRSMTDSTDTSDINLGRRRGARRRGEGQAPGREGRRGRLRRGPHGFRQGEDSSPRALFGHACMHACTGWID